MKLNYKRTILVGFAFFLICAFWQIYDVTIAMTLTSKFGLSQTASGVVMALDNILALFLLPLFGTLSDKKVSKSGRRTPFIRTGTVLAVVFLLALSFVDNAQLKKIERYSAVNDPATMELIYDEQKDAVLHTPEGVEYKLSDLYTREEFAKLTTDSKTTELNKFGREVEVNLYTRHVVPARQACAAAVTAENPAVVIVFLCVLLALLVSMATFRTPAVALMPDVTVKPLRSKANAVINLMGNAGGIIVLALGSVLAISKVKNAYMSYTGVYAIVGAIMLAALVIFLLTVKEPKWAAEMQQASAALEPEKEEPAAAGEKKKLSKAELCSLIFLLASIVLWFFGYNAVTSKYTVYAQNVLDKDATTTLLLANVAAIVAYLPVGMVASKIGRKKTIMAGVVMLFTAFFAACFMTASSPNWLMSCMFCLAGVAWATINVNSFPMVVEMCSGADVGKYTGFYYTASMAAQSLTPTISGIFMDRIAMTTLFPYASVFVGLAFVTMIFVKHGDSRPQAKKGLEALEDMED
ncbi:MAG: SLC45 family MFS transporter [Ruminococcaceae bacterium]|nr:SLC45 family MFS transporter [Oscillospiraceae bacterium]